MRTKPDGYPVGPGTDADSNTPRLAQHDGDRSASPIPAAAHPVPESKRMDPRESSSHPCSLQVLSAEPDTIDATFCLCRERSQARVVNSEDLLQGQRELIIVHGSDVYRLYRTRNNKLILQK